MRTQNIIAEKLVHWTTDLGPRASRIAIFEHIRDIPYAIVTGLGDPIQGPIRMLDQKRGYCEPKHFLMYAMYQRLGIPVKYATYPFRWGAQDLDYPRKLEKLADKMPTGYHLACKVKIKGEWILVDATLDLPLKRLGFPVNESWDGACHTLNAVKPEEEIIHENEEERMEYVRAIGWRLLNRKEKALSLRFYDEFNKWSQKARNSV